MGAIPKSNASIIKRRSVAAATLSETRKDEHGDVEDNKKNEKKKGWFSFFGFGNEEDEEDVEDDGDEEKESKDDDDDDGELKELLSTFKSLTGLWEDDPPDSRYDAFCYHLCSFNFFEPLRRLNSLL